MNKVLKIGSAVGEVLIEVAVADKSASVTSNLKDLPIKFTAEVPTLETFQERVDGFESVILAHAGLGGLINVQDPKYVEGIQIAAEAIFNHA